jgi:hypothetical protein
MIEVFRWPDDYEDGQGPNWLLRAIEEREVRVIDGDAHVAMSSGWQMVRPGDWIIESESGAVYPCSAELYAVLKGKPTSEPTDPLVAQAVDMVSTLGSPPFSSAVLARSAKAREAQAEYEKNLLAKLNAGIAVDAANPKPDPHNAQVEGANTPE